ncbi:hypothetical protein G3V96_27515 [Escherichia coli]|nr:hypothetical protein [Escherichia coli]
MLNHTMALVIEYFTVTVRVEDYEDGQFVFQVLGGSWNLDNSEMTGDELEKEIKGSEELVCKAIRAHYEELCGE